MANARNKTVKVIQEDFETLCICAIRYCHGRKTYMPTMVQEIVLRHLQDISDVWLETMIKDCEFQKDMNLYGDERIDKPSWLQYEKKLRDEQLRRTLKKV